MVSLGWTGRFWLLISTMSARSGLPIIEIVDLVMALPKI